MAATHGWAEFAENEIIVALDIITFPVLVALIASVGPFINKLIIRHILTGPFFFFGRYSCTNMYTMNTYSDSFKKK